MRALKLLLPLAVLAAAPSTAVASDLPYREPAGSTPPHCPARDGRHRGEPTAVDVAGRRADPGAGRRGRVALSAPRGSSPRGIYRVTRGRARDFATALRGAGVYRFAEPNRKLRPAQAPPGGDEFAATDWRAFLIPTGLTPPPLTQAPLTAVIDGAADPTIPDLAGIQVTRNTRRDRPARQRRRLRDRRPRQRRRHGRRLSGRADPLDRHDAHDRRRDQVRRRRDRRQGRRS